MKRLIFFLFFVTLFSGIIHAQPAFLDSSFGNNGIIVADLSPSGGDVFNGIVIQPDHKIVAAGTSGKAIVIRYMENGSIDNSFAVGGIFGGPDHSTANAVTLQPDGKILTLGWGDGPQGSSVFCTIRLDVNGLLDPTFGDNGIVYTAFSYWGGDYGYAIALQPDGKIIIAGNQGGNNIALARLLDNGMLDSSFGDTGVVVTNTNGNAKAVALMPDGRIVAGGLYLPGYKLLAMRFLANGQPDTSFNHTGIASTFAGDTYNLGRAMSLQPDGKIIVGGSGTSGAEGGNFTLVRFNVDGSLDASYGDTGVVSVDFNGGDEEVRAMTLDQSGKLVVAGYTTSVNADFAVARINGNGTVDSTFGINGRISTAILDSSDVAYAVAIQEDGKIILAGSAYHVGNYEEIALARYQNVAEKVNNITEASAPVFLYPNPSSGKLNISSSVDRITNISACDVLGNNIHINRMPRQIQFDKLAPGLYFFTIYFESKLPVVQKIFIEN